VGRAKTTNANPTYLKQALVGVRTGTTLAAIFVASATICFVIWGMSWGVKLSLLLLGFSVVMTLPELLSLHSLRQTRISLAASDMVPPRAPNDDFEFTISDDKYNHYERRVMMDGYCIRIQILDSLFSNIRSQAEAMAENIGDVAVRFREFKNKEAQKMPALADEIIRLEIDTFLFLPHSSPSGFTAEVYLTPASGGEPWTARWDGLDFRDLRLEP
jgi:hypothetical protein